MPTDYSNFSTPDNRIDPNPTSAGQPAESPARWDPVTQRWVGSTSGPVGTPQVRPAGSTWDPELKQWVPVGTGRSDGSTNYEGTQARGDATTAGRVEGSSAIDGFNTGGTWGGYAGHMVRGPDGKLTFDGSMSGRAADVERMRGLGATAANRAAYVNNYGQADADAAMGAGARAGQDNAIGLARNAAMGLNSASQVLGRNMLNQGVQAQQAAAMSTRGGSLAQAAAMRRQQGGQAAFMQQGNNALRAAGADEMEAGRLQYQKLLDDQRKQDAEATALHNGQAISNMKNEIEQRELNQTGQMGYENMAQNVNKAAQDAALKNREIEVGIDAAAALRNQKLADRDMATAGSVASTGGTLVAGLGTIGDGDGSDPRKKKRDDEATYSDARTKSAIRPMSLGAAAARRVR